MTIFATDSGRRVRANPLRRNPTGEQNRIKKINRWVIVTAIQDMTVCLSLGGTYQIHSSATYQTDPR